MCHPISFLSGMYSPPAFPRLFWLDSDPWSLSCVCLFRNRLSFDAALAEGAEGWNLGCARARRGDRITVCSPNSGVPLSAVVALARAACVSHRKSFQTLVTCWADGTLMCQADGGRGEWVSAPSSCHHRLTCSCSLLFRYMPFWSSCHFPIFEKHMGKRPIAPLSETVGLGVDLRTQGSAVAQAS